MFEKCFENVYSTIYNSRKLKTQSHRGNNGHILKKKLKNKTYEWIKI